MTLTRRRRPCAKANAQFDGPFLGNYFAPFGSTRCAHVSISHTAPSNAHCSLNGNSVRLQSNLGMLTSPFRDPGPSTTPPRISTRFLRTAQPLRVLHCQSRCRVLVLLVRLAKCSQDRYKRGVIGTGGARLISRILERVYIDDLRFGSSSNTFSLFYLTKTQPPCIHQNGLIVNSKQRVRSS